MKQTRGFVLGFAVCIAILGMAGCHNPVSSPGGGG
jgi:hypothetical protein